MSNIFCCISRTSSEKGDASTERTNPNQLVRSPSPGAEEGCCCYRCIMTLSSVCGKRRKKRYMKPSPEVCDAAVGTETDYTMESIDKGDKSPFHEGVPYDEVDVREHKYASLQFDSKPGKVRYIEGSQVFFVDVKDKRVNHRKGSISEDEPDLESDVSTDILVDRRYRTRKHSGETSSSGANQAAYKYSPATSTDNLNVKKYFKYDLHNIEESQEQATAALDSHFHGNPPQKSENKEMYSIDGGHFQRKISNPEEPGDDEPYDEESNNNDYDSKAEMSTTSQSVESCIQVNPGASTNSPRNNPRSEEFEEAEFADVSSQSGQETRPSVEVRLQSPTISTSTESNDKTSLPRSLFYDSLFSLDLPGPRSLTDDPSGLILMDRTYSMTVIKNMDQSVRESCSCPDVTIRSDCTDTLSITPVMSRENSIMTESLNTETGVLSVETQTDSCDAEKTPRPPVQSVSTETESGSDDGTCVCTVEQANDQNDQSGAETSNTESTSSSDSDSSFSDSESSLNSDGTSKKKRGSNTSVSSTCSTSSSSTKSVRKNKGKHVTAGAYKDKKKKKVTKKKISSSSSSSGSSCSCTLSSISSLSSSSTTSNLSDCTKDDHIDGKG